MKIIVTEQQIKNVFEILLSEDSTGKGVADRYMEKNFQNFYTPTGEFKKFEDQFKTLKQDELDKDKTGKSQDKPKVVGFVKRWNNENKPTRVYLNPKDLTNFDPNTRAISLANGDLLVAQLDGDFNHTSMGKSVNTLGILRIGDPDDMLVHAHWHRVNDTNSFGCSDTFWKFASHNMEHAEKLQKAAQDKNPQFKFILQYWDGELISKKWKK